MSGMPQYKRAAREATLSFQPPASVKVVGSFLLRTMCLPKPTIDVAVEMPGARRTRTLLRRVIGLLACLFHATRVSW